MSRRIREEPAIYAERFIEIAEAIKQPIRDVPFGVVIRALYGHEAVPFDHSNAQHLCYRDGLLDAAHEVVRSTATQPLVAKRPNEAGNAIEECLLAALKCQPGWTAEKPRTKQGAAKASGYPDLKVTVSIDGRHGSFYLECKTYDASKEDVLSSTFRSFYLSPSEDGKVTCAALHFLLAFGLKNQNGQYSASAFKLLSLDNLSLDMKFELNSDNRRLYSGRDGATLLHPV